MYAQHGREDDAIELFAVFHRASREAPNESLLTSILKACAQSRAVSFGEQMHGDAVKPGMDGNVYVGTALINLYAKASYIDAAILVFDALSVKNPVTWTTVVTGYSTLDIVELPWSSLQRNDWCTPYWWKKCHWNEREREGAGGDEDAMRGM
jgi:hypothetical protein